MSNEVVLVRYSVLLQPDGQLRSQVDNIDPDTFLKMCNEVDKNWEGAPVITKGIKYVIDQLKVFDADLDRYLMAL